MVLCRVAVSIEMDTIYADTLPCNFKDLNCEIEVADEAYMNNKKQLQL